MGKSVGAKRSRSPKNRSQAWARIGSKLGTTEQARQLSKLLGASSACRHSSKSFKPRLSAVSALALGSASAFADLGEDMDTLAENLQVVQKTTDAGELKAALTKMRTAAEDAKKETPPKLEGKAADSAAAPAAGDVER